MTTVRRAILGGVLLGVLSISPGLGPGSAALGRSGTEKGIIDVLEQRADRMEQRIALMERSARRFRHWLDCVLLVPVDELGDGDHRFGFLYDEGDGTGIDHRPALVVVGRGTGPDYHFLRFADRAGCQSHPTRPGTPGSPGTADPAFAPLRDSLAERLRRLERQVADLADRIPALERMGKRFDEWESCLTMVGITEYGDPDGGFGYRFVTPEGSGSLPALAVDISEWDDPDYFFLTFKGRDRPFVERECKDRDGEEVDFRPPTYPRAVPKAQRLSNTNDRLRDVRQELASLGEDVQDLWKDVGEFEIFDQCMYTIGVSEFGSKGDGTGYVFARRGRVVQPAMAMDVASFRRPMFQFMGYPGEEPPSIECNEDADPRPPNSQ